ncbi:SMI1/KNR4 family protein [Actinoplanes sp. ATCC 53533]|uniref:SMI1/KNR4 family protein n=1 Tax=Actinoplanes sp. ATCC 53533 TaxID=1288362 RepID=UPI0018F5FAA9|nr:SMI1/KNR4 family protein [Actinoplanes sp. ATCC 53533]
MTWEPLLRLLWAGNQETVDAPGGHLAGNIGHGGWSLPLPQRFPPPDQVLLVDEKVDEAVRRVLSALTDIGLDDISFVAEISPTGTTTLHLLTAGVAVDGGSGPYPGALVLIEGAVAEPWRRPPNPTPGAVPARSADPALLERTLRERIPDAIGATDAEIAAAEARLGIALPDELTALYRVTRARWQDWADDDAAARRVSDAVGLLPLSLDTLSIADASSRPCPWEFAAMEAVVTPPDAAVQGLVGSPGWIMFAADDYGDQYAVDLTPGPRGHRGQIITLSHELDIGAALIADSLTDLVVHRRESEHPDHEEDRSPVVAHVNRRSLTSVEAAAHPDLEVLSIGDWDSAPLSLAAVTGLPRLRTLAADHGTLADPLEIAELTGLEFLELAPEEWRILLDAGKVPRSLSAAAIKAHRPRHPLPIVAIANELLTLWERPPIVRRIVEGHLTPEV